MHAAAHHRSAGHVESSIAPRQARSTGAPPRHAKGLPLRREATPRARTRLIHKVFADQRTNAHLLQLLLGAQLLAPRLAVLLAAADGARVQAAVADAADLRVLVELLGKLNQSGLDYAAT